MLCIKKKIAVTFEKDLRKAFQETNFEGRCEACGPRGYSPPNFINIAKAYGIKTMEINSNSEFEKKIDEFLNIDEPIIVDVNCHDHHTYEPRIFGWKTPIEDMYPYINRDEFKKNMIIKPIPALIKPPYTPIKKNAITKVTPY